MIQSVTSSNIMDIGDTFSENKGCRSLKLINSHWKAVEKASGKNFARNVLRSPDRRSSHKEHVSMAALSFE